MFESLSLSPLTATLLLVAMLVSGRMFREAWKIQKDGWQRRCWGYGIVAFAAFAGLAAIPFQP